MLCILILVISINFFIFLVLIILPILYLLYYTGDFQISISLHLEKNFIIVLGLEVVRISMLKGPLIDASHLINRTCIYRIIN
jgi:hypothetical protein